MPAESQTSQAADRARRRTIQGVVVSDKTPKMRVVSVERRVRHAFYEKVVVRYSRFYVHDEGNEARAGDEVEIMSCRPMSRLKRWRLVRVLKRAKPGTAEPRSGSAVPGGEP